MTDLSDRQHDAFDNATKMAWRAGNLESRDDSCLRARPDCAGG